MNPFFLLLGLFGASSLSFGGKSSGPRTPVPSDDTPGPVVDDEVEDTPDGGDSGGGDEVAIALVAYNGAGKEIREINDGGNVNFGTQDVSEYKIGARVSGDAIKSVRFEVDGQVYLQNQPPYNMPADALDLSAGNHTITLTVHSQVNGRGPALVSETIAFETVTVSDDTDDDQPDDQNDDDGMDMGGGNGSGDQGDNDNDNDNDGGMDHGDDHGGGGDHGDDHSGGDDTGDDDQGSGDQGSDQNDDGGMDMGGGDDSDGGGDHGDHGGGHGDHGDDHGGGDDDGNADDGNSGGNNGDAPAAVAIALVAYDASGAVARDIDSGDSLDFGNTDVSGYTLGAEITGDAQSVLFEIGGQLYVQNVVPYNMPAGALDFSDGNHEVKVTAHSGTNGQGEVLGSATFTFDTTAMDMDGGDMGDDDGGMDHGDHGDGDDGGMDHGDHGGGDDGGDDSGHGGGDDGGMDHGDHGGGDDGGMDHGDHGGGMDHGDHGNHGDQSTPDIPPPGVGASQSAINAFVSALSAAPEVHVHDSNSALHSEHNAAMDLVERGDATHVAIGSGSWDNPNIWSNGEVPGDNAKVLIPDGVTVDYDTISDARLFTVRVDGKIDFATDTDSKMVFDTFVVSPTGHLVMGTANDPVDADVNIDLIVANNGKINTNWDPMLLSRGLISHGKATIHGAEKDSHEKVTDDPMAGDRSVKFDDVPEGWQVGDTIVVAGTFFEGYTWGSDISNPTAHPSEDEVRVITDIDDNGRVWFDDPLVHDHDTPRADLKTSVANYTRNVSIETENGDEAEVYERGHVMFMHSDDVDVRYAEFLELGRTDKSEDSANVGDFNNVRFDTNVQGRYSLHLHRTGVTNYDSPPAIVEGNAVVGSPGWGFVHHDSHAELTNNASFDTYGAGYVAETGNETGVWDDNIAIYAQGIMWNIPKNTTEISNSEFDTAKGGDGFWFQGRMVESTNNVAASVNTGFVYFHRDGNNAMLGFQTEQFEYSEGLFYSDGPADDAPILSFDGNETFAASEGQHVVKGEPNQEHDNHSHLDNFTAWSVSVGAHLEYTSHYILTNFDLIGKDPGAWQAKDGISIGNNTSDLTIIDAKIEGFGVGIDLNKKFLDGRWTDDMHDYTIIDPTFKDVGRKYESYDPRYDTITSRSDLPDHDPKIDINGTLNWSDNGDRTTYITGTKTDGLGKTDYPGGTDFIKIERRDIEELFEREGYWTTSGGKQYVLVDLYFTDRLDGEIYYETQPVYINQINMFDPRYKDAIDNGVQNITTVGGVKMAGDRPLDVTIEAVPNSTHVASETLSAQNLGTQHTTHASYVAPHDMADMASAAEGADMDADMEMSEVFGLEIGDGDLLINATDTEDMDLTVSGGAAVLATDGTEFDVSSSRTLAVFEAAAKVGFDGDKGETAILDMHEGATLAFAANDGGLGTIEEFSSGAFGAEPDVLSGIDLGNAKLSIDLSGLSAEAGTAFTLMDADEIVGVFEEAVVGGLGARNAKIVVDYENDSVSLQLVAGEGAVEVETLGLETEVTSGEEALWAALTADHGVHADHGMGDEDDEDHHHHMLDPAA